MPVVETSASDVGDLLDAIAGFADSIGWTVAWNVTSNGGQVGLSDGGDLFVAFGRRIDAPSITRNMQHLGGTREDVQILGTLATGFSSNERYNGGHPGAPGGTSSNSTNHAFSNDWGGSFSNVWLMSDAAASYIHVIAQRGNDFNYLSMGLLDTIGMSVDRCPYYTGSFFEFWERNSSVTHANYSPNRPSAASATSKNSTSAIAQIGHDYPFATGAGSDTTVTTFTGHLRALPSVVDSDLFPSTPAVVQDMMKTVDFMDSRTEFASQNRIYSNAMRMIAMPTSIGRPIFDLPLMWPSSRLNPFMFFGNYPDVKFVWLEGLNPGQVLDINGIPWQVFPAKQKRNETEINTAAGNNSWNFGFAFRRDE